jgi:hypothetical protein
MSNVNSARHSIEVELEHARQGAAFYEARVTLLEDVLATIENIDESAPGQGRSAGVRKGKPPQAAKSPAAGTKRRADRLPSTGKGFWPGLITSEPKSASDIMEAAIKALGIAPDAEQSKKLMQRMTNALHTLVKTKEIQDSGSGRDRRFFRAQ